MNLSFEPRADLPRVHPILRNSAIYLILAALLFLSLQNVPFKDIGRTLLSLEPWQIGLLMLINMVVITLMAGRWWIAAQADVKRIPFLPFIAYRLAVFGISYFTPGPQVGGEPLQVSYMRRHGASLPRAISIVIIDKLLELLGNFLFIGMGLLAFLRLDIFPLNLPPAAMAITLLLLWPPIHILLLRGRFHPITSLIKLALPRFKKRKWFRLTAVSERLTSTFIRRHPKRFFFAMAASLLTWAGMAAEYILMLNFLGMELPIGSALVAMTAAMLAFLLPMPGGLGALEASQVLALGALGFPAASAISLALLMRLRDVLNSGIGLLLAACLMNVKNASPTLIESPITNRYS